MRAPDISIEDLRSRLTCTVPEMAAALGIGVDAAYAGVERGELPAIRVGRRLIVPVGRLLEFIGESPPDREAATPARAADEVSSSARPDPNLVPILARILSAIAEQKDTSS